MNDWIKSQMLSAPVRSLPLPPQRRHSVVEAVKSDAEFLHGTRIGCLAFDDVDMEGVYTWPVKDPGDAPVAAFNLLEWMLWPEPATAEGRS